MSLNLAPDGAFDRNPRPVYAGRGPARFSWAADQFHSPSRSVKIVSWSAQLSRWVTRVPARATTLYTLSVWVKPDRVGGAGRVRPALTFWSASGSYLGVAAHAANTRGTWQRLKVVQIAPRGTAFVRIELRHSGRGTSWWDDVVLTDRSSAHRSR